MSADFSLQLVPQLPAVLTLGSSGTVIVRVHNIGDEPADGALTAIIVRDSGTPPFILAQSACGTTMPGCESQFAFCSHVPTISPGESFTCSFSVARTTLSVGPPGIYRISAQANAAGDLAVGNNSASIQVRIGDITTLTTLQYPALILSLVAIVAVTTAFASRLKNGTRA